MNPNLPGHVQKLMTLHGREALHKGFTPFRNHRIAHAIGETFTNAQKISHALTHLNEQFSLEKCGRFEEGIAKFIGEPVILKEELSVEDFFSVLDHSRPLIDEGVSPIHGKFTHAIQHYIIEFHFGKDGVQEIFDFMRSGPVESCDKTPGRKWTLWDEFFDRPAPFEIPNTDRKSCRDAICFGHRNTTSVTPCLDARSPEWLTTVIALSPNLGIDYLHHAITSDLGARANDVHENIFVTGLESTDYLLHFSSWHPCIYPPPHFHGIYKSFRVFYFESFDVSIPPFIDDAFVWIWHHDLLLKHCKNPTGVYVHCHIPLSCNL